MTLSPKLKAGVGYALFGLFAFALFLYLTFPYDTLRRRVTAEAESQGFDLHLGSLGPGLFGITAKRITFSRLATHEGEKVPTLDVASVSVRPSLFPLGMAAEAKVFGGTVDVAAGGISQLELRAKVRGLDPSKAGFKDVTGVEAQGRIDGQLSLDLPKNAPALNGKPTEPNLGQANGSVSFSLTNFTVLGGTVVVPVFGTPTPVDLPKIALGNANAAMSFAKGMGTLKTLRASGGDLELLGTGTLRLERNVQYSEPNLEVKLKADPAFVKRLGLLGSGLTMLPEDRETPGFRVAHLSGFLSQPNFAPGPANLPRTR